MKPWQVSTLETLKGLLEAREDVLGVLLFGSCGRSGTQFDAWSDVDILLVVKDDQIEHYFPTMEWLAALGPFYTYSQSSNEFMCTTRVCFEDFRRIDAVITTEASLANVASWPAVPFFAEKRILFSRSRVLEQIARRVGFPQSFIPATEERFLDLVRDFHFKSVQAAYKVVRGDLLIALHLMQDLLRDCCVLGMMLRDRATGTNIHKQGCPGNLLVAQLERAQQPFTPAGILTSLAVSNEIFENLAREWSSEYQENHLISQWIERAKASVLE